MVLTKPTDKVGKFITMPRWERNWVEAHNTINFSGLIQELLIEIIKTHDPEYYKQNEQYLGLQLVRRKEVIQHFIKTKNPLIQ